MLRGTELRAELAAICSLERVMPPADEYTADNRRAAGQAGAKAARLGSGATRRYWQAPSKQASPYGEILPQALELWQSGEFGTVFALAEHLGCNNMSLARHLRAAGAETSLNSRERARIAQEAAHASRPPGCLCIAEVGELTGKCRSTARKRIVAKGIKPALQRGNVSWYREADLRAAGLLP